MKNYIALIGLFIITGSSLLGQIKDNIHRIGVNTFQNSSLPINQSFHSSSQKYHFVSRGFQFGLFYRLDKGSKSYRVNFDVLKDEILIGDKNMFFTQENSDTYILSGGVQRNFPTIIGIVYGYTDAVIGLNNKTILSVGDFSPYTIKETFRDYSVGIGGGIGLLFPIIKHVSLSIETGIFGNYVINNTRDERKDIDIVLFPIKQLGIQYRF